MAVAGVSYFERVFHHVVSSTGSGVSQLLASNVGRTTFQRSYSSILLLVAEFGWGSTATYEKGIDTFNDKANELLEAIRMGREKRGGVADSASRS
jgi:hypothetical protein